MVRIVPVPMRLYRPLFVNRRLVVGVLLSSVLGAMASAATVSAEPPQDRTITEDVPELLKPRQARTEAEEDLLTSGAHFAQARLYLQRQNEALALRHFQRAWRFNPDRVALLDQVVAVASELGRNEQAARYAILSAERRPRNARLLIQLGGLLAQQNDAARALRMYENAVELQREEKVTPQSVAVRIEMGRLYFLNEDFKNAAQMFSAVRDALDDTQVLTDQQRKALLPKPHALYSLIAASFLKDEQLDEAAVMFRKADSFEANPPQLDFHLANIAVHKGAFQEARELLDRYLDSKSTAGGVEPYRVLRKVCKLEHADADDAESAFLMELRRRHEGDPENLPLGYFWAGELLERDDLEEAQGLYVDLLKRQATADAYIGLAEIYRRQQNVMSLLGIIEQVAAQTESLDVLADELARTIENQELVKQLLDHARDKCKDASAKVRHATALAAAHLAIETKQLEQFDAFASIAADAAGDEKAQVLEQLGLAVFVAEDAQRAARLFQAALDEDPDEKAASTLQYYLAGALQFAGDTEAALVASTRAAELRSESPRFASRKPWILYQAKQHERAERLYLELIEKYEPNYDTPDVRDVIRDARLILSNIAVERKQLPQAEEWLAQVLDEFPEDIGAKNDLGYLWADQGKHLQRALVMIKKAVEAEPENIAYRDSLGWVYYRLGRFADAIRELKIATAGDEPDGVILDHLGDAHLNENQPDQAVAAWQKALSAFRKADHVDNLPAIEAKINKHSKD
ncbi:MAG: hypothetical protein CMJ50_10655 [Planctomycetaceae bacterium]|nr:hypothetical protein [Planctomycetaceae bacterium]